MVSSAPREWIREGLQRLREQYPELAVARDVSEVMAVDRARVSAGRMPSAFTRDVTRTAADSVRRSTPPAPTNFAPQTMDEFRRSLRPQTVTERDGGRVDVDVSRFGDGQYGNLTDVREEAYDRDRLGIRGTGVTLPERIFDMTNLSRPGGAFRGSVARSEQAGDPFRGTVGAIRGAIEGFRDPDQFQPIDSSLAQRFSDTDVIGSVSPRDIAGLGVDVLFDPIDLALGGTVATDAVRLGRRGARALSDDAAQTAIRAAEGPLEASTRGVLDLPDRGFRPRVAGAAPQPSTFDAPPTVARLFGVKPIEEGAQRDLLTRVTTEGRFRPDDPVVTPAMVVRDESRQAVTNQATRVQESARSLIDEAGFEFDDAGRIPSLAGIDPSVPGGPTLRDVAARLPNYEPFLSDEQLRALDEIRELVKPYRQALDEVAQAEAAITGKPSTIRIGSRADVMDGGFYIPRGNAETDELADIAQQRFRGGSSFRAGGKQGFEQSAEFASEAEGIAAGYRYTDVADALGAYVRGIGNRTLDRHAANYFLTRMDDAGRPLGTTPLMRAMARDPQLATQVRGLRSELQSVRGALGRLTERQQQIIDGFIAGQVDDIDDLRDALDGVRIGANAVGVRGPNFGQNVSGLSQRLDSIRQQIRTLQPQYRELMQNAMATPRDAGRIPLAGLEGRAFPWEIADEARRVLEPEMRRGDPGAILRAVNGVLRGVQATAEMSYLGIQGAVAMASGNRAWRAGARAGTRAWLNGGENTLGYAMRNFDQRALKAGRPTLEQWAAVGGRLGGGNTEFRLARGPQMLTDIADTTAGAPLRVPRSVARRADRGFGTFGDVTRMELWDMLAEEQIARLGRPLTDAEMRNIVQSGNRVTGWTSQRLGGDWGEALNFAPRYLASRIQTLAQLGSRDPMQRALARRLIGRYIALASTMTIAINEINGEGTDFRPFRGERGPTWNPLEAESKNPNFMRVRNVLGRDWSLLGPVDATMGILIGAGSLLTNPTADPKEAIDRMRAVFTSPLASAGLDWLVFGENFEGEELNNARALAEDLMTRVVPFAVPELVESLGEVQQQAGQGERMGAASEAAGAGIQVFLGFRGTPLSLTERVQVGEYGQLNADDQFRAIPALTWRELGQMDGFGSIVERYDNIFQYLNVIRDELAAELRAEGMTPGQIEVEVESAISKNPVYQEYTELRRGVTTAWVLKHPAEAVALWSREAQKPWADQDWRPTVDQREIMEAYLRGQQALTSPAAPASTPATAP